MAAGGALGSVSRYILGMAAVTLLGPSTGAVWGTLAVNLIGSAAIGAVGGALSAGSSLPVEARLLAVTGFLGGFTTFSAFAFDAGALWARSPAGAALYVGGTVAGGLAAFAAAFALARRVLAA